MPPARSEKLNLIRQWIRMFPEGQKEAITEAFALGSLGKIRRALRLFGELSPEKRGPAVNVEVLSTFNLEPLLPVLRLAISCLPSQPNTHLAPLDDIEAQLAQPAGSSSPQSIHARIIVWRIEELLPEALYPFSYGFPQQVTARVDQLIERIERIVRLHKGGSHGTPLFLSTIALPLHFANPVFAVQHHAGLSGSIGRVNQKIYEVSTANDGVYVLDLAAWAAWEGRGHADAILDFLARQPFSAAGQVAFALFIARSLRPLIVPRRKALALDLDNTLWGGVVGEDGVEGLSLGHDFPGNVHLRIQRELLELRNRGVLLVIVSKNNEADAREAFESLPDMVLKWDDFAAHKINWKPKHENLREAARELGLGLDSFVLIDDSDYEREQIRQFTPEVLILNESSDALQLLRAIWETDAFDSLAVSDEDWHRHHDYAVRVARSTEAHQDDMEAFLQSLQMEATIEGIGSSNLERVVTMLGKTNQFNLTTRRHSRTQVQAMLELPGTIALAMRLRDKFGDQGIIALLLAVRGSERATLIVDSFLVSCRALGRGVEDALWAAMVKSARRQNINRLEMEYIPTSKNSIVSGLYDRLGLKRLGRDNSSTRYFLEPVAPVAFPSWISLTTEIDES